MNIIQPLNTTNLETVLDNIIINQNRIIDSITELNNKIEHHNLLLIKIESELAEIKSNPQKSKDELDGFSHSAIDY
jgi:hypothetical protein